MIWTSLFTFSTLISFLIVNNAAIIFRKIPNEIYNLNLTSHHISKGSGSKNTQEPEMIRVSQHFTYGMKEYTWKSIQFSHNSNRSGRQRTEHCFMYLCKAHRSCNSGDQLQLNTWANNYNHEMIQICTTDFKLNV